MKYYTTKEVILRTGQGTQKLNELARLYYSPNPKYLFRWESEPMADPGEGAGGPVEPPLLLDQTDRAGPPPPLSQELGSILLPHRIKKIRI